MTWEGWFRVISPPNGSNYTSLLGTYGANHDGTDWAVDGIPATRRRYGALWIDTESRLSVTTNNGGSTGLLTGTNLTDQRWHHLGVVWRNQTGGYRIAMDFQVLNADILQIQLREDLFEDLIEIIKNVIGDMSKTISADVAVTTFDDSNRAIGGWYRFGVTIGVNAPAGSDIMDTEMRLGSRILLAEALGTPIRERIMLLPYDAYPVKPFNTGDIYVDSVTAPNVTETGSVSLYVDGILQSGKITYDPGEDYLSMDGEFVVAGGYLGIPLDAEVQNVRLWSRALTPEELLTSSTCRGPTAEQMFGGEFPHELQADYIFDGDYLNAAGTDIASIVPSSVNASFVRGGRCGYETCPEADDNGCPLVRNRQLRFNTTDGCETFARFNFCRTAGQDRGRPPYAYFDGCHSGGGDQIAEITL
jgi:hypothetical protein